MSLLRQVIGLLAVIVGYVGIGILLYTIDPMVCWVFGSFFSLSVGHKLLKDNKYLKL